MDERALQFRVGAMVVGTVFIAVLLLIIFNYSPSLLRGRDTIFIKFATARSRIRQWGRRRARRTSRRVQMPCGAPSKKAIRT